ncbi:MAG: hypothetical protein XXXJIFNMEKO3_00212 [Candidatus Erwinia impunctatus]|nr:hypothetical protein XXXJIFNMEKO_00212 [Culicoides impunctatus]
MDRNTQRFTSYWRNSLADAESGRGAFKTEDQELFTQWREAGAGRVNQSCVDALFSGEDKGVKTIQVVLRPQVWIRQVKHGKARMAGAPEIVTPLVTAALLSREGFLFPTAAATIPRELLEPLPNGTLSIGEMAGYDKYKTTQDAVTFVPDDEDPHQAETDPQREERYARYGYLWQKYLTETDDLLSHVAGEWRNADEQYERADYGYITKASQAGGASKQIIALYDHLLTCKKAVPLLARFAAQSMPPAEPVLSRNSKFSQRLGHVGDSFPLANAQRDALSHYLTQRPGDMLAVNGPPGTGKTTLLLSIIATEWVSAALRKSEPPLVIATSTNNRAVTNIIEAFGKDFSCGSGVMAGRWLPEITSFGAYFPSSTRRADAEKKYQTEDFFTRIESPDYMEKAQLLFL